MQNCKMTKLFALFLCLALAVSLVTPSFASEGDAEMNPTRITASINGDSKTSIGFCWYTGVATDSKVEISLDGSSTVFSSDSCTEWDGKFVHKVTVSELLAGKKYTYRVGNGSIWSDWGSFVTDDGDDSFNFITIADVQASSADNFKKGADTLSAAFATMPDAEFVVNCGDFTNDSTNEEWDLFDSAFASINASTKLAPVSGNHDGLGVWHWFENIFNLDTSESVQTLNGVNYSFDYGNSHFAVLNTNDLLSISLAQLKWLENDMNSTDKDWKIVAMHKSPYTLGKDGKWPDALYLQKSLTKVLDRCNVDLVMSGHDHMYLRTKALTGNKLTDDGTVYVLAGTAGSKRYEVRSFLADSFMKTDFIGAMTVQKNNFANYWNGTDWNSTKPTNVGGCFNCISVDGGTLTFNSYILADEKAADNSRVTTSIDSFTLTKQTGQNVATFSGDNTTSEAAYAAGVAPSFAALATYTFINWLPKFLFILPAIIDSAVNDDIF